MDIIKTNKKTVKLADKKEAKSAYDWAGLWYFVRHMIAVTVLAAGSVAFIVQNAENFLQGYLPYVVAGAIVGLVLFFGFKK